MAEAQGGFIPARDGIDPRNAVRIVLGLIAVTVAVLASLALLESFVLQPAPGEGPSEGAPREEGGGRRGGADVTCNDIADFLKWTTLVLGLASAALLGVGVARRHKNGGNVGSSAWGILSIIAFFFALVALGGWRVTAALCDDVTCRRASNGTYTAFLLVLTITLASVAFGIFRAWQARKNYFATGWGVLATVLYLPTVLVGFAWYLIRLLCSPDLSCAARDEFLDVLAWMFWLGLLGGLVAVAVGFWFQKRWNLGVFGSGWGVLAVKLVLVSAMSGYGWIYVDGLYIPGCDPPPELEEQEEPEEPPTCEETRDDLRGKVRLAMTALGVGLAIAIGTGIFVYRNRLKEFFRSPFAVAAYVLLGLLVLAFLGYLLLGSMCDRGDGDEGGDDGSDAGDGDGDGSGSGRGGGSGGGGRGSGSPGGAGGTGPVTPVNINIDPRGFLYFVIALAVVLGLILLASLLRKRKAGGFGAPAAIPAQVEVAASESEQLRRLLDARNLTSTEAVIAAYRAFLAWSEGRGIGKREEETPREHALRVLERFPVASDAMDDFVTAYEVARLSAREPTPQERAQAVEFSKRFARPGVEQE